MLGNGLSPEVFAAPCGLTTKGLNLTAAVNEFNVPDCDDPDAPMFTERVISSLSAGVTGSGILDMGSFDEWREWHMSGLARNIQVTFSAPGIQGAGYFEMSAVLTTLNFTGNQGELVTVEIEIQSNGQYFWYPAAS
jgi:hypothetical protein